ncbi:ABC transporter ATP-binding protein [bacterium]|nr:MAG: ABC transporter ATP-binding protein [bacterium]
MADPIFAVRDLVKGFGGLRAVDGATFEVSRGSITALIGPNGAGKTTLFNLATGFIKPDRGAIEFEGESIFGRPPHAVAKKGMVRTFQITKALAAMTVLDNMMLAASDQPGERILGLITHPFSWRPRERAIRERALELLERFRLDALANAYAGTLSGGQRKLLEFARLLMAKPRMVLLDEPLAGVNPVLGQEILAHVHELRTEQGITFLFIEHDMEAVMSNADRVVVMAFGRVIATGLPSEVRRDRRVIDAYLGAHGEDVA